MIDIPVEIINLIRNKPEATAIALYSAVLNLMGLTEADYNLNEVIWEDIHEIISDTTVEPMFKGDIN